jgi:ATP-dependent Clp protease protease subunit
MDAILRIYSIIGTDEGQFSSDNLVNFLDKNKEASNITVRIKSPGGSVREGWTIHDLLLASGKKIKTIAEGELYSIATVIFLAGSEREIFPNADGLIHMPRIPNPEGEFQAADLRDMAQYMDKEEEKILNLYMKITGKDAATLREYMNKETMLSAQDMVDLGFATRIAEPLKAVAYYNYKSNKMEEKEFKTFSEKLDTLAESVKALFSRLPATDQKMTDKDGKEFKLEKETGAPAVGDKASPDGTYTMVSGEKITVAGGVVSEITESDTELAKANAKIAELEAYKTAAEAEKATIAAAKVEDDKKVAAAVALVTELTALKNTWKPEGRSQNFSKGKETGTFDLERAKKIAKDLDKSETIKTE